MKQLTLLLFALGSFCVAQPSSPASAANVTRYTLMLAGNKAGFETVTRNPDGSSDFYYEFNDRGRGPKITEHLVLDKTGIPVEIHNSGNDYDKAQVEESFSLKNAVATWKNRAEQGERKVSGSAFYVSISGAPDEAAVLARALLGHGGHLPLLPAGEASIARRSQLKVAVDGDSRIVDQYAVSGLDFVPDPVWLDAKGNLFASVGGWFVVVQEGWESTVEALRRAQDEFDNQRTATLAKTLGHKPSGPLAFVHANLFDSSRATIVPNSTVVITGNKITSVGEDGKIPLPQGAEVIDARNQTLTPGLWDMHVHLSPNDGLLDIANGITSVRDLANDIDQLGQMRARFDDGSEIGPRVLMAGFIDGRGPYAGPTKVFADTEQEARDDIDRYAKLGYVQIKIYSSVKPELVPKIAEMAHAHGMRVSGHVPAFMTAEQFVKDGADEIQHMNFIFLNFMFDQVKDTRTPARFTEVATRGADIDPASPQVQAFVQFLRQHKTVLDPTLNVFEGLFTDRPGQMSALYASVADRFPAQIRRGFLYGGLEVPAGQDQRYRDSFQQMLKMTKTLYDAGVPIVAGTDAIAGFTLARELELYQQAGIPAPKVLQLATLGAAQVMKQDEQRGSVEPGKLADVILIDGNPAKNVAEVRKVNVVVKDGVVYRAADLDRALGVKPLD
ncbi:MAG TPA: amidohydrolase family protein [Terriglobales bacterium]|nr:amidohydrolase family protein [Terriglobales bacterium]